MNKTFRGLLLALLIAGANVGSHGLAQEPSVLDIRLGFEKSLLTDGTVYLLNDPTNSDPITAVITVQNISGSDLLATKGFLNKLHLSLRIEDPDGLVIGPQQKTTGTSFRNLPVIPEANQLVPGDPVEFVAASLEESQPFGVRDYYTLLKPGPHTATAFLSASFYPPTSLIEGTDLARVEEKITGKTHISNAVTIVVVADADRDEWCTTEHHPALCPPSNLEPDCDDSNAAVNPGAIEVKGNGRDDDCNLGTSDFQLSDAGNYQVIANNHIIGGSGQRPGSTKEPIPNMHIRIFDKSDGSCVKTRFGVSWRNYPDIWNFCPSVFQGDGFTRTVGDATGEEGTASLTVGAGEHVIIGLYDPDGSTTEGPAPALSGDELHIGVSRELAVGETKNVRLQVIVRGDGTPVGGRYRRLTSSELLIIEPDYVEWESDQELYPFIFESIGDWTVTTTVTPPEGFVTDANSLSEEVDNELEAVQFTLTDVGSEWVPTEVDYNIYHNGKRTKIKSQIGVKLSKKLADQKGVTVWGEKVSKKKRPKRR